MTEYKFPHSDHLSPSQITEYLSCPLCFKLNRIDKMPRPMSVALPIGGSVHKAVERFRFDRLAGKPLPRTWDEMLDIAAQEFDERSKAGADNCEECWDKDAAGKAACSYCKGTGKGAVTKLDLGEYENVGKAKDHAIALAQFILPQLATLDDQRKLVAVELDLKDFESPWPFPMHGRVDALYSTNGEFYTAGADLKTSSRQQAPTFGAALQVGIYRSFIPGAWFADVLAKTKLPSFQTYTLDAMGDDFVRDIVLEVSGKIMSGEFPARPGYLCSYAHGNPTFSIAVSGFDSAA